MEEEDLKLCQDMAEAVIRYREKWDNHLEENLSPDQRFLMYDIYSLLNTLGFKFTSAGYSQILILLHDYVAMLEISHPVEKLQHSNLRKYKELMGEVGKIMKERGHGDLLGEKIGDILDSYRNQGKEQQGSQRGVMYV